MQAVSFKSPRANRHSEIQQKKQLQFQLVQLRFAHPAHPRIKRIVVMPANANTQINQIIIINLSILKI